jgi:hypothetical protein
VPPPPTCGPIHERNHPSNLFSGANDEMRDYLAVLTHDIAIQVLGVSLLVPKATDELKLDSSLGIS